MFSFWGGRKHTADGSVFENLNIDKVKNSLICLPNTIEEQEAIVKYLDGKCAKIDAAVEKQNQIIEKLNEYKKSLIYYAVTGKIDAIQEA